MKWLMSVLALVLLAGCAPSVDLSEGIPVTRYVYTVGVGDRMKIAVFGEEELTGEYIVNSDGLLAFPLIGGIPASGKTVDELKAGLEAALGKEYIRNPRITVTMASFRPVYILGEVSRPGEFPYVEKMSVFALVAKAGGFTYRAEDDFAYIRQENETEERAVRLTSATAVRPGDTIRIPERRF